MDKQTFDYLCKFYGIKKMLVELPSSFTIGMKFCKKHVYAIVDDVENFIISKDIVGAMSYWNNPKDENLVKDIRNLAYEQIEGFINTMKKINSPEKVDVKVIRFNDYKECEQLTWNGTLREVFTKMDRTNNSLRYCNGSYYKFNDNDMEDLRIVWYNTNDWQTNFDNYYLGQIVD